MRGNVASTETTERRFVARDRDDGVVVLVVRGPGLVPQAAIDVSAAGTALDEGRASLWILAQTVEREPGIYGTYPYDPRDGTTDNRGERPPIEKPDVPGHHLLVFEGEVASARLQAAVEAGRIERAAPGAYVTRTPVTLAEAQEWASDGTLVAAFRADEHALGTLLYQDEAPLDFVRISAHDRATALSKFPPEWQSALAERPALLQRAGAERLALDELCTQVRAVNAEGDEAQRLVALFEAARTPRERSVDPWPAGVIEARGFTLPERGAGRTVRLTRPIDTGATVTLLLMLGPVAFMGYMVGGHALGHAGYISVAIMLAVAAVMRLHSPWRVQLGRHEAIIWRWTSRRECSLADAMRDVRGTCAGLATSRLDSARAELAPAVIAVREWLDLTRAGRAFQPAGRAPMALFAVDDSGVRPLGDEVWATEPGWQTARGSETEWKIRVDELRRAAPNASIVLVPRREDTHAATLLASSTDSATAIRRAVRRLGGRVA
jgi:hypothetical protein